MSLLTHLLSAEVRRLRVTIGLWITALVVEAVVGQALAFVPQPSRFYMTLIYASRVLLLAIMLLSWALVPLVLQLHPAVGSRAFWMTRPIPPRTLVMSKLVLLAVLFVAVPLAIEQIVMAIHRVLAGDMTRVAIETAVYRGVLLVVLASGAALTPNLARFALLCGAALFGVALLPVLLMSIDALTRSPDPPRLSVGMTVSSGMNAPLPEPDSTAALVGMTLLLATGVLAVAVQYQRRCVRDSVIVLAAGAVLAFFISSHWRWAVIRMPVNPPAWAAAPDALQLRANLGAVRFNPPDGWHGIEPRWVAHAPLTMTPAQPGWVATARVAAATLGLGGDVLSTKYAFATAASLPDDSGEQPGPVVLGQLLGVGRVLDWGLLNAPREHSALMVQLPPHLVERAGAATGVLKSEFLVDITKLNVASVMPLARASFRDGSFSFSIQLVRETPTGLVVYGRRANVRTMLDPRSRPGYWFFLRNHRHSVAIRGTSMGAGSHVAVSAFAFGFSGGGSSSGFSAVADAIAFDGRDRMTPDAPMIVTREWLRDAELVVVRATHEGSVQRTLELVNFPLARQRADR